MFDTKSIIPAHDDFCLNNAPNTHLANNHVVRLHTVEALSFCVVVLVVLGLKQMPKYTQVVIRKGGDLMSLVHIAQAASTILHVATLVFAAIGEAAFGAGRRSALAYVKA